MSAPTAHATTAIAASLRVLLLQARRPGDPTRTHELACFAEKAGLSPDQLEAHNLVDALPSLQKLASYDALLIGGSGEFYVSRANLPGFEGLLDRLRALVDRGPALFGSCFGYQCLVEALGGRVIHDPPATEVGTFELELTPEGREDPLLGELPQRFTAQMGHKDRAATHPPGIPNLARSALSPLQALRVPDRPIWATQFHPELCQRSNRKRFEIYREGYAQSVPVGIDPSDHFGPSVEASTLLRRFFELVF